MTRKPTATHQTLDTDQFVRETVAQIRGFRQGLAIGQGQWIHLGCGGELVRLQGVAHPVCTSCAREVW
jgi:hypothetical protein